ncbi:YciI family protein [Leifsonia sp. NPDC058230]|uniref:YciI family protein n=1 Tax=Leifsonia sp. NPDC058230 TaxID=3346391 RepID=UPI0036DF1AE1
MTQYLLSVYQPDGPIPSPEALATIGADLDALNDDMRAAGVWVFSNGLLPPSSATTLRPRTESVGDVLIADGPFAEGKEHLGGFTIIDAPDLDAALAWGKRLATATTLPIEVRPFAG